MKILHTSDWHLGKRLFGRDRLNVQRAMGEDLVRLVHAEKADLVLMAGDLFDTAIPSGEAEQLFYDIATQIGDVATLVVISGNHDDPARLMAARSLARLHHIIVVGDYGEPVGDDRMTACGNGWVRLNLSGETVNIVTLPYMSDARTGELLREGETYGDRVKRRLGESAAQAFSADGVNLTVAHLFCMGGIKSGSERDIELGTARIVPLSCLPQADYTALGHIHRPLKLTDTIWYSGAPTAFTFDDDADKSVNLYDSATKTVRQISLPQYDRLCALEAFSVEEALAQLAAAGEALTMLTLHTDKPLLISETKAIKAHTGLVRLVLDVSREKRKLAENRADLSPTRLFEDFCLFNKVEADSALTEMFLSLVGEV